MSGNPAVSVANLCQVYGSKTVLELPSLELPSGTVNVLVGGNGAGKTTLLRCLAGLEQPTAGSVRVLGQELYRANARDRLHLQRRMTLCFQNPYLLDFTVRENVEYALRPRRVDPATRQSRAAEALDLLGLSHLAHQQAQTLSGGEGQRLSLARALALRPELALLDEPVASVDPASLPRVEAAIRRMHEQGATVVVATHHMDQANVIRLEDGRLAPPVMVNLLEGEVSQTAQGAILKVAGMPPLMTSSDSGGTVRAAIDPDAIILSHEAIESSARNCLVGTVVSLTQQQGRVRVTIDAGVPLVAHITQRSLADLGLTLGTSVHLTFKSSSVVVF